MDNFQAIGQLVTEARNLLDAIKGGAIRQMEVAFESIKQTVNSEWSAIKSKANNDVLTAIGRIDADSVMGAIGFTAQNYNADFLDVITLPENAHGHQNQWPKGFGIHKGFNDFVKTEIIPVDRVRLNNTDPDAISLLDAMSASAVIARSFNILKVTILDTDIPDGNVAIIPDGKVITNPSASFLVHMKRRGELTNWLGDIPNEDEWTYINRHYHGDEAGDYVHMDIGIDNSSVGNVLYIALPTVTTGLFPKTIKHGVLFNGKTEYLREVAQ